MRRVFAIIAAICGATLCGSYEGLAQYLTGSARNDFIKTTAAGCIRAKAKANEPDVNVVPNSLYEGYCRCYAGLLADKLKIADMEADNTAVTDPIVKAAGRSCYEAMKVEALRLYKAGQYPKQ